MWKVSKYGVISGKYFPVFGLNTRKYGPEKSPYFDTFHVVLSDCENMIVSLQFFPDLSIFDCCFQDYRDLSVFHFFQFEEITSKTI